MIRFILRSLMFALFIQEVHPYCPLSKQLPNSPITKIKSIPKSEGSSFFLGDIPIINQNFVGFLHDLWEKYQEPIVELAIPFPSIFSHHYAILDPEMAKSILLDKSGAFTKGLFEKLLEKCIFSPEGIIFMDANKRWEILNKQLYEGPLNPACFPDRYAAIFKENFVWFMKRLNSKKEPFELYREITYYTMRTMAQALFNYNLDDDELISIADAFAFMMSFMYSRETQLYKLIPLSIPFPSHQVFYKYLHEFNTALKQIIKKAPHNIVINNIEYPTITGILKEHRDPDTGITLTTEEIQSHIATIFFAAHDTTSLFLTMLIHKLSTQDEWRTIIQNEVLEQCAERPDNWAPIASLCEYTKFKNEILRLYPPLPIITINTTEDVVVNGYFLPKNSVLCIGVEMINTHPLYFKNPHTFNPNRFNSNDPDYTQHTPGTLLTFVFGFRRCIGQWFAQAEAQVFISLLLLHNISFDLIDKHLPLGLAMKMTGMPNRSIWVQPLLLSPAFFQKASIEKPALCTVRMKIIAINPVNETGSIYTYRLAPLHDQQLPFAYQAGDHIEIMCTTDKGDHLLRHYSISSAPTDSTQWIEITVKKEAAGLFSPYFIENARIDDTILIRAPLYDGVDLSLDDPAKPLILISGGVGITPMLSITRSLIAQQWQGDIYFIHSAKNKSEVACLQELLSLAQKHPNFHLIFTFTRSKENLGNTVACFNGRMDQHFFKQLSINDGEQARVYICGNSDMCTTIKKNIETLNIPLTAMRTLSFGTFTEKKDYARYSRTEVAQHNKRSDAWIIIDNIVYDITGYLDHHPGFDIILDYLGTDASQAFAQVAHSAHAKKLLNQSEWIKIKGFLITD